STITTSVIFLPVVFMQTISGSLFQQLALVVVFALVCSLFVALTLVPMLCSKFLTVQPEDSKKAKKKNWFQRNFAIIEHKYSKMIERTLDHKPLVFAVTGVLVVASLLVIPFIPVELAPQSDADEIDVDFMMAEGTNIAVQNEYLRSEEHTSELQSRFDLVCRLML